jgi:hypothetical protein
MAVPHGIVHQASCAPEGRHGPIRRSKIEVYIGSSELFCLSPGTGFHVLIFKVLAA